ncbi:hypothetical protein KAW80_01905 [Candidatus Babeliales bacterium]|nr:hypothetical protein [Candidatus Babeliales bacterium]
MFKFKRSPQNPILLPNEKNSWETEAVFNGCPAKKEKTIHFVYRALSTLIEHQGKRMHLSSIGHALSTDGINFRERRQLIKPEYDWEKFGCEDPRVTKLEGEYFIFYTALSTYPFSAKGIKIGVAITKDFKTIKEKHLVTPFNSKAMALFPQRINGKIAAILTMHTDLPPAKIAIVYFDHKEQIFSEKYWQEWYERLDHHVIPLLRSTADHLEVGTQPIKTKHGWLLLFSYIKNYFSDQKIFGVEAVLLDLNDPAKVIGRTKKPILIPETNYELHGKVPNIIFPSGAFVNLNNLYLYYGAADTSCCLAVGDIRELLNELRSKPKIQVTKTIKFIKLQRFVGNPIITPRPEFAWEAKATFNSAAIYLNDKVHLLYRAMSKDNTSTLGYATSKNGYTIDERLPYPVYLPRENFESKKRPGYSGCEDPRITKIGNELYMCYTAYDSVNPPRVALTSITIKNFLDKKWLWEKPKLISPPNIPDKNTCIFPKKINEKYVFLHRIGVCIYINFVSDLNFEENKWLEHETSLLGPRGDMWDNKKVGITGLPIETKDGWLLIYHGVSNPGNIYKLGAALLDLQDPSQVIARTDYPILEPVMAYEKKGCMPNVVFSCGVITIKNNLFVYYGGADKVVGVATINLHKLLKNLKSNNTN